MKKIGIFAGTFDPIHDGHLALARSVVEHLELSTLYFMVESDPWANKHPVEVNHRIAMVNLAIAGSNKLAVLQSDDNRFDIIQTLPKIEAQFPGDELYFVFGADVFLNMNKTHWPGLQQLLRHYIVVFERGLITQEAITNHAKSLGIVVAIIPSQHPHHRSSDIRLKPQQKEVWVPKSIGDYIDAHKLYPL